MASFNSLQPGRYYHLYNRGNNGEDLFREERNYRYFLELYAHHIQPLVDTFAYCLMRNHFHLLIRVKTSQVSETCEVLSHASQCFSNLFNAYAKAINKAYSRTGSLFQDRFHRIEVTTDQYFTNLVYYIHMNPQKHGFVADFRDWSFSSYRAMLTTQPTRVQRGEVLTWFGGVDKLIHAHQQGLPVKDIAALVEDDFS
jgi:putative transposase